jgi:hypothetical protein
VTVISGGKACVQLYDAKLAAGPGLRHCEHDERRKSARVEKAEVLLVRWHGCILAAIRRVPGKNPVKDEMEDRR